MPVKEGEALAVPEIPAHEGLQGGGLARAGLANRIHVAPAVGVSDAEAPPCYSDWCGRIGDLRIAGRKHLVILPPGRWRT